MLFQNLAVISAFAALAAAQDVDQNDIPQQCTAVCAEVVSTTQRCDNTTNTDTAELECVCRAPNAGTLIPTCEACVAQFENNDNDDDDGTPDRSDVYEILTRCNFTTTTYNSQSASQILTSIASASAATSGSVIVTTTSGTVVLTTNAPPSTQGPGSTGGVAPAKTAAVGMGMLGLVVGLL